MTEDINSVPAPSWSPETASQRLQELFARIDAGVPELEHVFTELFRDGARAQLDLLDKHTQNPLAGTLVSVKDLFDIAGSVTRAGTVIFAGREPASEDATAIARLMQAGAIIAGKTNMTELAYSGLGLNPHYGTPDNPVCPGHIPGGSTSGGAVSVATGAVDIAIGTDTGGSLRIPAAFTGITGFKPSQNTVPQAGCCPLSSSLDSIGPMARTVQACKWAWRCMSGITGPCPDLDNPELIVPTNFGMTELDDEVESGFTALIDKLRARGWNVKERKLNALECYKLIPVWQFASVESRAIYADEYAAQADKLDPRVRSRMARAGEASAIDYCTTLRMRRQFIQDMHNELGHACLLLPTVAILPPAFKDLEQDKNYYQKNILALRNTTMANVLDGCSISLPFSHGNNVIGAMLTATSGRDLELLELARKFEGFTTDTHRSV